MYRLLIVDDDPWMCQYLQKCIDWRDLGFTCIFQASNGLAGLELLKHNPVDILLSDVKMEGKDGIELLKESLALFPDLKVILLSGYDSQHTVREAFRAGAVDYLFKPVDSISLRNLIVRTLDSMIAEKQYRQEEKFYAQQLETGFQKLQEDELEKLLFEESTVTEHLPAWLTTPKAPCRILGLWNGKSGGLRSAIESALKPSGYSASVCRDRLLLILTNSTLNADQLCTLFRQIPEGQSIKGIAFSPSCTSLKELVNCQRQISLALWNQFYDDAPANYSTERLGFSNISPDKGLFRRFSNLIETGSGQEAEKLLDLLFEELLKTRPGPEIIRSCYLRLYDACAPAIQNHPHKEPSHSLTYEFNRFLSIEEMKTYFLQLIPLCVGLEDSCDSPKRRQVIEDAKLLIEQKLAENLSLESVAHQFYLNPAYFSRLFKETVGKTFTLYVMEQRVAAAKRMLKSDHLKIYEVGAMVGYPNSKYFTKIFKDFEGITPGEYRNKLK